MNWPVLKWWSNNEIISQWWSSFNKCVMNKSNNRILHALRLFIEMMMVVFFFSSSLSEPQNSFSEMKTNYEFRHRFHWSKDSSEFIMEIRFDFIHDINWKFRFQSDDINLKQRKRELFRRNVNFIIFVVFFSFIFEYSDQS